MNEVFFGVETAEGGEDPTYNPYTYAWVQNTPAGLQVTSLPYLPGLVAPCATGVYILNVVSSYAPDETFISVDWVPFLSGVSEERWTTTLPGVVDLSYSAAAASAVPVRGTPRQEVLLALFWKPDTAFPYTVNQAWGLVVDANGVVEFTPHTGLGIDRDAIGYGYDTGATSSLICKVGGVPRLGRLSSNYIALDTYQFGFAAFTGFFDGATKGVTFQAFTPSLIRSSGGDVVVRPTDYALPEGALLRESYYEYPPGSVLNFYRASLSTLAVTADLNAPDDMVYPGVPHHFGWTSDKIVSPFSSESPTIFPLNETLLGVYAAWGSGGEYNPPTFFTDYKLTYEKP